MPAIWVTSLIYVVSLCVVSLCVVSLCVVSLCVVSLCVVSLPGCQTKSDEAKPLVVFAAASTIDAMTEVLDLYSEKLGRRVKVNYASSSSLATMILNGVDVDLYLSANKLWADKVVEYSDEWTQFDFLQNQLVLVCPVDSTDITRVEDLCKDFVKRIAIADPNSVPAGIYAKSYFESEGIWSDVQSKCTNSVDVRQALALVEQAVVQAGLVYKTDAIASDKVRIVKEVSSTSVRVVYPIVWRKRHNAEDKRISELIQFLESSESKTVFVKYGFKS